MIKHKYTYLLSAIALIIFIANCKKDYDETFGNNKVVFVSSSIDTFSYYQATASSKIKSCEHNPNIEDHGHCWSIQANPDLSADHSSLGVINPGSSFTSILPDLLPETKYFVRPYAKINNGIVYGDEITFSTWKTGGPVVRTISISELTDSSAICISEVISDSGLTISSRGVCWNTSPNPTLSNSHTTDGNGIGLFESYLSVLSPGIKYYVRSYAKNDTGTSYGNEISLKKSFVVGQTYGGGIIFYVDGTGQHGLIAATSDQGNASWGCVGNFLGGTLLTIGSGQANTTAIVNSCPSAGIAARICNDLVLNGYYDWFLPSKDELNLMYLNKAFIGGFINSAYWSSSESSADGSWYQGFADGVQGNYGYKTDPNFVRAIRAF